MCHSATARPTHEAVVGRAVLVSGNPPTATLSKTFHGFCASCSFLCTGGTATASCGCSSGQVSLVLHKEGRQKVPALAGPYKRGKGGLWQGQTRCNPRAVAGVAKAWPAKLAGDPRGVAGDPARRTTLAGQWPGVAKARPSSPRTVILSWQSPDDPGGAGQVTLAKDCRGRLELAKPGGRPWRQMPNKKSAQEVGRRLWRGRQRPALPRQGRAPGEGYPILLLLHRER